MSHWLKPYRDGSDQFPHRARTSTQAHRLWFERDVSGESVPVYAVERLLARRRNAGVTEYHVKWQGFDDEEYYTWEPADSLLKGGSEVQRMVNDWEASVAASTKLSGSTPPRTTAKQRRRATTVEHADGTRSTLQPYVTAQQPKTTRTDGSGPTASSPECFPPLGVFCTGDEAAAEPAGVRGAVRPPAVRALPGGRTGWPYQPRAQGPCTGPAKHGDCNNLILVKALTAFAVVGLVRLRQASSASDYTIALLSV